MAADSPSGDSMAGCCPCVGREEWEAAARADPRQSKAACTQFALASLRGTLADRSWL